MLFDQFFTWPTDQPRHATDTTGDPVKSDRPLVSRGLSLESTALSKAYLTGRPRRAAKKSGRRSNRIGKATSVNPRELSIGWELTGRSRGPRGSTTHGNSV